MKTYNKFRTFVHTFPQTKYVNAGNGLVRTVGSTGPLRHLQSQRQGAAEDLARVDERRGFQDEDQRRTVQAV